jgi:hypothetical protein
MTHYTEMLESSPFYIFTSHPHDDTPLLQVLHTSALISFETGHWSSGAAASERYDGVNRAYCAVGIPQISLTQPSYYHLVLGSY